MDSQTDQICLVIANYKLKQEIKYYLKIPYSVHIKSRIDEAFTALRLFPVLCIIIQIDGDVEKSPGKLSRLRNQFPMIPMIALSFDHDLEEIMRCGELGLDHVISLEDLSDLGNGLEIIKEEDRVYNIY